MGAFIDSLDIANRVCDHLGQTPILEVDEDSTKNSTISRVYDQLREAELQRNVWYFAKRKVVLRPLSVSSRLLAPKLWQTNETYLPGAIVKDANGDIWISWLADNYGNEPGVSDAWDSYFGPMTVELWSSGTTYFPGELVYKAGAYAGSFVVFLSLADSNSDNPDTTTAWAATTTYGLNDRAYSGGFTWRSLITLNLNVTPAVPPADYSSGVTYGTGNTATASDGFIYTATTPATIGVDPVTDDGTFWTRGAAAAWSKTPAQYDASAKWLPVFSDMTNLGNEWLYVGINSTSRNVYRAPAGSLRMARIGYRDRLAAHDYEPHGEYITSGAGIMVREFIANIKDVRKMHAMFCEGLAIRIAMGTAKKITGSDSEIATLASLYNKFMNEARTINGIEMGPEEPDEDEFLVIREGGDGGYSNGGNNYGRSW